MLPIKYIIIFMSPIPKNKQIWPRVWQIFHFQKLTGTLKMNIFVWKFANIFVLFQRTIANFPKIEKNGVKKKNSFKDKEHTLFQSQLLKLLNLNIFWPILGLKSNFSEALHQVNKQRLKKNVGFRVLKHFGTA